MKSFNKQWMILCLLSAIIALAVVSGCARKSSTPPDPVKTVAVYPSEREVYSGDRAVLVHRGDESPRRYYRDDRGRLYYVDQNGAVHDVDRTPRVERGTAGLYYIIDDDNVNYYTDDRGRLFYKDTSGRTMYIEDSGAGRVIDPLPILSGQSYPRIEHTRSLEYCNDAWRKCNSRCNDSPGLANKRNCLENCDFEREQCLKPY